MSGAVSFKWFIKIFFEILIKTALIISGFGIIIYAIIVSKQWSRFDFFILLFGLFGLALIITALAFGKITALVKRFPKLIKITGLLIIFVFILSFIIVEAVIINSMRPAIPEGKTDYVIILGCQVIGVYPSVPLIRRVHTAEIYLKEHDEVKAIVTGGQGPGEDISEAKAMRRLLIERGVSGERILIEDRAKNTKENLMFCDELYDLKEKNIILVTTDYHMFRSLAIAKKLGYRNISGLASRSQKSVLPVYLFREYFAVVLYAVMGRI